MELTYQSSLHPVRLDSDESAFKLNRKKNVHQTEQAKKTMIKLIKMDYKVRRIPLQREPLGPEASRLHIHN